MTTALFIYVDVGYLGSFHDVTILKNSAMERNWRHIFTNIDDYCKFVLGDQGYIGLEKYIMHGFSKAKMKALCNCNPTWQRLLTRCMLVIGFELNGI